MKNKEIKLFNYQLAAIAESLYNEIDNVETSRRNWVFSLYYAIMKSTGNNISRPEWEEKYKQWNTDHLYRGALSSKNKKQPVCSCSLSDCKKNKRGVTVKGKISGTHDEFELKIEKQDFKDLHNPAYIGNRLLISEAEVSEIINAISEITIQQNTVAQNVKIESLWKVVNSIRNVYNVAVVEEKEYIETVIGAAIFYLPHPVNE
jgi:hypothetical protein